MTRLLIRDILHVTSLLEVVIIRLPAIAMTMNDRISFGSIALLSAKYRVTNLVLLWTILAYLQVQY